MNRWKSHLFEFLIALGILLFLSLLGLAIIFGKSDLISEKEKNETGPAAEFESERPSQNPPLTIGIPTTRDLVEKFTQASDHFSPSGEDAALEPPPAWLAHFESLAGANPVNVNQATKLLAYADTLAESDRKLIAYAMIADQADAQAFQTLLWPKVWNPSTDPQIARAIANALPSKPEQLHLPYLLALLQHPDEETRTIARGVLWGYFPDIPESEYPRAVQTHLAR